MMGPSRRPPGRGAGIAALVSVLAFALLGLTQCRMIGDRLTGVDASLLRRSPVDCIQACEQFRDIAVFQESQFHRAKIRACRMDVECLEDENQRHTNRLADIETEYQACLTGCHHQGGGSGGN